MTAIARKREEMRIAVQLVARSAALAIVSFRGAVYAPRGEESGGAWVVSSLVLRNVVSVFREFALAE